MMPTNPIPLHITLLYTSRLHGRIDLLPRMSSLIQRERIAAARIASTVIILDLGESCVRDQWLCEATAGRALLVAMDAFGADGFYLDQADPLRADPQVLNKLRAVIVTPVFSEDQPLTLKKRVISANSNEFQLICLAGWESTLPADMTNVPYALTIRVTRHIPNSTAVRYDPYYDPDSQTLWVADPDEPGSESMRFGRQLGRITLARYNRDTFQLTHQRLPVTPDLPPDPTVSGVVEFVLAEAGYAARNARPPA